jgi:hypothetical protein
MGAFGSGIVVIPNVGLLSSNVPVLNQYVNPAPPIQGINYVSKGERWDSIAYKMYGDASQIELLIQNNPSIPALDYVVQGAVVFVPLLMPTINTSTSTPWG